MNLLIEDSPDQISVGASFLKIKTDFKSWVKFLIALDKQDAEGIGNSMIDIVGGIPAKEFQLELLQKMIEWVGLSNEKTDGKSSKNNEPVFDLEQDGNVIFCELWQYFPNLMEKGITYHQGMELIKILIQNENTMLNHRAKARGCNIAEIKDKDLKKYWLSEKKKYKIKTKHDNIEKDIRLYNML